MRHFRLISLITIGFAGCGGSSTSDADAASDAAADEATDTGSLADMLADTGTTADAATDSGASDGGCGVDLTVMNYLAWCSVSVNGGAASIALSQSVCVAENSDVPLAATPRTNFELGLWHHTTGDSGSGDPGNVIGTMSTTDVMVTTGPACVWVCCPFIGGTGCPTIDQCP